MKLHDNVKLDIVNCVLPSPSQDLSSERFFTPAPLLCPRLFSVKDAMKRRYQSLINRVGRCCFRTEVILYKSN